MLKHSERKLALNTLFFSKYPRRLRIPDSEAQESVPDRKEGISSTHQWRTANTHPKSNYELFNCNNLNIRYWSWNYRGCWPLSTGQRLGISSQRCRPSKPLQNGCYCFEHPLSSDGVSTSLKPALHLSRRQRESRPMP